MISLVINKQLWLFYYYYLFPWVFLLSFSIFSSFSLPPSPFIFFHYYCYYSFLSPFRPLSAAPRAGAGRHRSRRRGGSPGGIPTRRLSADTCRDRSARSAARVHPPTHRHTRAFSHIRARGRARSCLAAPACSCFPCTPRAFPPHSSLTLGPRADAPTCRPLPRPSPARHTHSSPTPFPRRNLSLPPPYARPSLPPPGHPSCSHSRAAPPPSNPLPLRGAPGAGGSRFDAAPSGRTGRSCSWC